MAHAIETMAYTNETPWHKLGTYIADAPNVDEMVVKAGIDWQVEKRPISLAGQQEEIAGFYALTRDKDDKVMDIVGNRYTPVQNREAFAFFNEFVEAGSAKMETAGSLRGGRYVWGLANLQSSFKLAGGDEVKGYLLVASPHEQGKSMIIKFTTVRVVCNNTLTLALSAKGGTEYRFAHRRTFNEDVIREAKEALGIARAQMKEFETNARKLKNLELKRGEVIQLFADIYQPQAEIIPLVNKFEETATPTMQRLMDIYEKAPGADPGTGWGALNAVTYFTDHVASRTDDKRLTNAWLGKTSRQKQQVFNTLLKKAA